MKENEIYHDVLITLMQFRAEIQKKIDDDFTKVIRDIEQKQINAHRRVKARPVGSIDDRNPNAPILELATKGGPEKA